MEALSLEEKKEIIERLKQRSDWQRLLKPEGLNRGKSLKDTYKKLNIGQDLTPEEFEAITYYRNNLNNVDKRKIRDEQKKKSFEEYRKTRNVDNEFILPNNRSIFDMTDEEMLRYFPDDHNRNKVSPEDKKLKFDIIDYLKQKPKQWWLDEIWPTIAKRKILNTRENEHRNKVIAFIKKMGELGKTSHISRQVPMFKWVYNKMFLYSHAQQPEMKEKEAERRSTPEARERQNEHNKKFLESGKKSKARSKLYNIRKNEVIYIKKKNGCSFVGCPEHVVGEKSRWWLLDFHHRDPSEKVNKIANMIWSNDWENKIFPEIQKCDVVCANCHRDEHRSNIYDETDLSHLKLGHRKYIQYKKSLSCEECGLTGHPWALDFHHRDPNQKEFQVSRKSAKGTKWEKLKAEIDKCRCLCANCHRNEHRGTDANDLGERFGDAEEKFE